MFQGTNSLENESYRERTVQGTNVSRNEWSRERKFHHGNECSRERIVLGTNIPDTVSPDYASIWTLFSPTVRGPGVLYKSLNVS